MAAQETKNTSASSVRACQNCKQQFTIEPDDFGFYQKINVPPPTFCPQCRLQRRLSIRNERSLYKRICDLCKKETLSIYSPDKNLCVYCPECYRSDKWDPFSYGRDYDFSQSLFAQLDKLFREVPRPAINETNLVNCSYCEDCVDCKNLYLVFGGFHCEDVLYAYNPLFTKKSVDVTLTNQSELAYETVESFGLYNVRFSHIARECLDSAFLYDCTGCSDSFGCTTLRNKKYYIFNKPYSKTEYRELMKQWDLGSYATLQKAKKEFEKLYYETPRRFAITSNVTNVTGNNLHNARNCFESFSIGQGAENCKFTYVGGLAVKDMYDAWAAGGKSQLVYEATGCLGGQRILFTNNTHHCSEVQYSNKCFHCTNLFGCVGLKKKNYCILNKQYSKEEYASIVAKIIEQARTVGYTDKKGREYKYGEFFPIETMPFAYNETIAYEKFPLTQEQVTAAGYPWREDTERNYAVTMKSADLPDHIKDVTDAILNETISCAHDKTCMDKCTGAFRIIPRELAFYKQINVPLPRLCPNCRHGQRAKQESALVLFDRRCQCSGGQSENKLYRNQTKHDHGDKLCQNVFKTTYAPNTPEIIYCETCFQRESI